MRLPFTKKVSTYISITNSVTSKRINQTTVEFSPPFSKGKKKEGRRKRRLNKNFRDLFQVGPAGGRVRQARTRFQLGGEAAVAAAWVAESAGAGAEEEACWGLAEVAEAEASARGAEAAQGEGDRGTSRGGTPSAAITNRPYIISSSTRPSSYTPFIPIICRRHTANTVRRPRVIPPWISRWIFAHATCKYIYIYIYRHLIVCSPYYVIFLESFTRRVFTRFPSPESWQRIVWRFLRLFFFFLLYYLSSNFYLISVLSNCRGYEKIVNYLRNLYLHFSFRLDDNVNCINCIDRSNLIYPLTSRFSCVKPKLVNRLRGWSLAGKSSRKSRYRSGNTN